MCSLFDPAMLVISADPYQSSMTVLYQRLTVIVTDVLLYYAILQSVTGAVAAAVGELGCCPCAQLNSMLLCPHSPMLCLSVHADLCRFASAGLIPSRSNSDE